MIRPIPVTTAGGWQTHRGDGAEHTRRGPGRRRRSIQGARGTPSRRAARALLPDAGLAAGRRGRAAGDLAALLAGTRAVRSRASVAAMAVPNRDQRLPECA